MYICGQYLVFMIFWVIWGYFAPPLPVFLGHRAIDQVKQKIDRKKKSRGSVDIVVVGRSGSYFTVS